MLGPRMSKPREEPKIYVEILRVTNNRKISEKKGGGRINIKRRWDGMESLETKSQVYGQLTSERAR